MTIVERSVAAQASVLRSQRPMATHGLAVTESSSKATAVGTCGFFDSGGDGNLPLSLNSNGTLVVSTSGGDCTGLWVQFKKSISWDLNSGGACVLVVFAGKVTSKGLSSAKNPGNDQFGDFMGTWNAVRTS